MRNRSALPRCLPHVFFEAKRQPAVFSSQLGVLILTTESDASRAAIADTSLLL